MPKGMRGFQKGHKGFGTKKSYIKAGKKISKANKGHPQSNTGRTHFKKGHGMNKLEENPQWKNGLKKHGKYIAVLCHYHPFATKHGYVLEHRLVMEKHIGRYLTKDEDVHHINGIKNDNRIENLMLCVHGKNWHPQRCPKCGFKFAVR